jgi:hypothetical protein
MKLQIELPEAAVEAIREVAKAQGMTLAQFVAINLIVQNCPVDDRRDLIKATLEANEEP